MSSYLGSSHTTSSATGIAWVEAYLPTHGWRGFDPTNNLLASEHPRQEAIGRDCAEVPPTRGTANERLQLALTTRILEQALSQAAPSTNVASGQGVPGAGLSA